MNSLWNMEKELIFSKYPEIKDEIQKDYTTLPTYDFIDKWISYFPELSQARLMCMRVDSVLSNTVNTALFAKRWKNKALGVDLKN